LIKGKWVGAIGGLVVFLIILSVIIYFNSDFDQQLIQDVESGIPAGKLIPKIDNETAKLKVDAKRRLESHVMDMKFWGNGDLASENDYKYYTFVYENEMDMISEYDKVRKRFVKKEISKEKFLQGIKSPKEYLNRL